MGINTLGTLLPGNAYYVLVSDAVEVVFGECMKSFALGTLSGLVPWELAKPTPSSHSIAVMPIAIKSFDPDSYPEGKHHRCLQHPDQLITSVRYMKWPKQE